MRVTFGLVLLSVLLAFGQSNLVLAQESASKHEISGIVGAAWNDSKSASFAGIEYEYRMSDRLGFGGYYETTWRGFDLEAVGALATYHPNDEWKFMGGAGIETKLGSNHTKGLFRIGTSYIMHAGSVAIMPTFTIDWVEDNSTVTYLGIAVGFHL